MTDQTQAVYAAEDLWEAKEPQAKIRFGDWNEVQPFYVRLAARFREEGEQVYPPTVRPRRGALKAHYDAAASSVYLPPYSRGGSWALVTATAIHEFAHHLAPGAGHGPEFRAAMVRCLEVLGWDVAPLKESYASVGLTTSREDDGILSRVEKIYAQAEAPGRTVEEKKVFLEKAQRMASDHSIDLALMRKKQADTAEKTDRPTTGALYSLAALPSTTYRNLAVELGTEIGHAHGVRSVIRGKSSFLTFFGFEEDIQLTELMLTRVTPMMFEACDEYLKSPERKASGVAAVSARITFCKSFAREVGARLEAAVRQAVTEWDRETGDASDQSDNEQGSGSAQLALREKEVEVADYTAHEFKKMGVRGSWKGSSTSNWNMGAKMAGQSAGQQADLFGRKELS